MTTDYQYFSVLCKVHIFKVAVAVAVYDLIFMLIRVTEVYDSVELCIFLLDVIGTGCLVAGIFTGKSRLLLPDLAIYILSDIYYFGGTLDDILGALWPKKFANCEEKPLGPNDEYNSCVQEYVDFALRNGLAYASDFLTVYVIYRCYRYLKSLQEKALPTFHDSNHMIAVKNFANPNLDMQAL